MPTFMKALPTPRRPPRCARPPERDHATPIRRTPRPRTSVQQRDGARVVRTVAVPPDVAARVDALARADTSVSAPLHAPPLLRARLARERRPIKVAAGTDALARSAREAVLLNSSPEEVGCNRVERLFIRWKRRSGPNAEMPFARRAASRRHLARLIAGLSKTIVATSPPVSLPHLARLIVRVPYCGDVRGDGAPLRCAAAALARIVKLRDGAAGGGKGGVEEADREGPLLLDRQWELVRSERNTAGEESPLLGKANKRKPLLQPASGEGEVRLDRRVARA